MSTEVRTSLNFLQNQLLELVIENASADPTSPSDGRIYFNTVSNKLRYWNGGSWIDLEAGTGNVTKVGTPVDNQISVWTGDGTIEGSSNFTFDGTTLSTPQLVVSNSGINVTGNLVYNGSSSGSITVAAPAVAGSNTITWPASSGTVALTSQIVSTFAGLSDTTVSSPSSAQMLVYDSNWVNVTMGGDGSLASDGTFTLTNSGVSAGTVGGVSLIPVLTIDAKGRITNTSLAGYAAYTEARADTGTNLNSGTNGVLYIDGGEGVATHGTFSGTKNIAINIDVSKQATQIPDTSEDLLLYEDVTDGGIHSVVLKNIGPTFALSEYTSLMVPDSSADRFLVWDSDTTAYKYTTTAGIVSSYITTSNDIFRDAGDSKLHIQPKAQVNTASDTVISGPNDNFSFYRLSVDPTGPFGSVTLPAFSSLNYAPIYYFHDTTALTKPWRITKDSGDDFLDGNSGVTITGNYFECDGSGNLYMLVGDTVFDRWIIYLVESPIAGYVPTTREIASGEGLSGGGDLSTNRTLSLDFGGLSEVSPVAVATDMVAYYDGTNHRKVSIQNLNAVLTANGLSDTNFSSLTDWDVVRWDNASSKFINSGPSTLGGQINFNDLSDIDTGTTNNTSTFGGKKILKFNSTSGNWEVSDLSLTANYTEYYQIQSSDSVKFLPDGGSPEGIKLHTNRRNRYRQSGESFGYDSHNNSIYYLYEPASANQTFTLPNTVGSVYTFVLSDSADTWGYKYILDGGTDTIYYSGDGWASQGTSMDMKKPGLWTISYTNLDQTGFYVTHTPLDRLAETGGHVIDADTDIDSNVEGDGAFYVPIPPGVHGDIVNVGIGFITKGSGNTGATTIQLAKIRDGASTVDVCSTEITIDANEANSSTAATPPVINTSNNSVQPYDLIRGDIDTSPTGGTLPKGLFVVLSIKRT